MTSWSMFYCLGLKQVVLYSYAGSSSGEEKRGDVSTLAIAVPTRLYAFR